MALGGQAPGGDPGAPAVIPVADQVAQQLAPYLGPFNAKVAVKTFSQKALKLSPEAVTLEQLPALLDALRPMLHTLVGQVSTEALLAQVRRVVR